jgi:hypothetical protein
MTNKEYRQTEGISRSELFTILSTTPMHFLYEQTHPKEDTPALAFGRATHKAILEPETFSDEFVVAPKVVRRTKDGKETWNKFVEDNAGKEVITEEDFETLQDMKAVIEHDVHASAFLNGIHEQSFFWTDSATGEKCKVRPDCITEVDGKKYLVDYKTTDSCADGAFERSVRKYGYKFQSGMYREGYFQNTFEDVGFVFVAQEKTAPYAVRVYICSDEFLNEGYTQFREAIGIYHECKTTNHYWGYEGPDNEISELIGEEEKE